jgi:hypothetical protein
MVLSSHTKSSEKIDKERKCSLTKGSYHRGVGI